MTDIEKEVKTLQENSDVLIMGVLKMAAAAPNQPTAVKIPFGTIAPAVMIPPVSLIHGLASLQPDEIGILKIDIFSFLQTMCVLIGSLYHFDEKQIPEVYNTVLETNKIMPNFLVFAGMLRRVMEINGTNVTQPDAYKALLIYIQRNTLPANVVGPHV